MWAAEHQHWSNGHTTGVTNERRAAAVAKPALAASEFSRFHFLFFPWVDEGERWNCLITFSWYFKCCSAIASQSRGMLPFFSVRFTQEFFLEKWNERCEKKNVTRKIAIHFVWANIWGFSGDVECKYKCKAQMLWMSQVKGYWNVPWT